MIEVGKKQILEVCRKRDIGVFLGVPGEAVDAILLPKRQVPAGAQVGDKLEVFVYRDSEDRLVATVNEPKITVGELAVLKVIEVGKIGAFLDWGLEKDLLLPFKEQTKRVQKGEEVLVVLYADKSNRLCGTMNVYDYLSSDSPYKKDDWVEGRIYDIKPELGALIAVDDRYYGMIFADELFAGYQVGDMVKARVSRVREDGKLDLSGREKAYLQMDTDAQAIMKVIDEYAGALPFNDKASPDIIKRELNLSKNAFKRAVGRLLKEGRIEISEKGIRKLK